MTSASGSSRTSSSSQVIGSGQVWLTVPTHTAPPSLAHLIDHGGLPVVVVHTTTDTAPIPGAVNVHDDGPPNISRWWNTGLDEIARQGGTVAVVANHDIIPADSDQLPRFAAGLIESGATLARATRDPVPADTKWHGHRELTGWCFAIDLTHGLRPNEDFRWWFGDDWLDLAARLHHHGVAGVPAKIRHERPNGTLYPNEFHELVIADRRRWDSASRALLK